MTGYIKKANAQREKDETVIEAIIEAIKGEKFRRGRSFTATLDATVINSLACHIVERLWMELAVSPQASETASIPPASTTA